MATYFILIAIGIYLLVYTLFKKTKREKLLPIGERVEGIIFDLDSEADVRGGNISYETNIKNLVMVRFATKKEEWITGKMQGDFVIFYTWQYKPGDKVRVIYNPQNPHEFVVETGQAEGVVKIVTAVIGLGLIMVGLFKLFSHTD